MNNSKNIVLRKINTLDDAIHPQKIKYPDNTIGEGLMYDYPEIGKSFMLYREIQINKTENKVIPVFITSKVVKIVKKVAGEIVFTTLNSTYEITY